MANVVPEPGRSALHESSGVDPTTEISDGVLADGRIVELIRDGSTTELKLLVSDGTNVEITSSVQVQGQTFLPIRLDPGIQRAVTLPSHASDYGSTKSLFSETRDILIRHGTSEDIADSACYYAFRTWFPERSLPAPCLVITGPSTEATVFLQLLGCFVRRGLPMVEIDSNTLRSVAELCPTLLIDGRYLGRRSRRLLSFCGPGAHVPCKGSVVDVALPKVIYLGASPVSDFSVDFSIHIHLWPSRANATMLDEKTRRQIIADFQPKFLDYQLRNFAAVHDSVFDLPGIDSEGRVIARMLGACIVDSAEIQAGVRHLLLDREGELRAERWTDLTCVVIEVLLAKCHVPSTRDESSYGGCAAEIHVNEIAKEAEVVLKGRGAPSKLEPCAIGGILRRLKLDRRRDARGKRIVFSSDVRRHIHSLARNHQVESIRSGMARCDLCKEIFEQAVGS